MKITRTSVFGVTRTLDLNVTSQQIKAWEKGALAQIVFNNLDASEREFIINGNTDEDWDKMFEENADTDI